LAGQRDDVSHQLFAILTPPQELALHRAVLPERAQGATLGNMQMRSHILGTAATTRGVHTKTRRPLECSLATSMASIPNCDDGKSCTRDWTRCAANTTIVPISRTRPLVDPVIS